MSDQVDTTTRIDPNEELTPEKKLILLNQWREKVEAEIAGHAAEREKVMTLYKSQKEKFDRLLGEKVKRMKKYDAVMNSRKKVLAEIMKEIAAAAPQPEIIPDEQPNP